MPRRTYNVNQWGTLTGVIADLDDDEEQTIEKIETAIEGIDHSDQLVRINLTAKQDRIVNTAAVYMGLHNG